MQTLHVSHIRGVAHLAKLIAKHADSGVRFEPDGPELSAGSDCQWAVALLNVAIEGRRRRVASGIRKARASPKTRWGGQHSPALSESQKREVFKLRQSGHTYKSIADHLGVSEATVWRACKKS